MSECDNCEKLRSITQEKERELSQLKESFAQAQLELGGLEALFKKESERLDWLDQHTSFVADEKYNIGPYKVGGLRAMADDGIEADHRQKPTTLRENLGQG